MSMWREKLSEKGEEEEGGSSREKKVNDGKGDVENQFEEANSHYPFSDYWHMNLSTQLKKIFEKEAKLQDDEIQSRHML